MSFIKKNKTIIKGFFSLLLILLIIGIVYGIISFVKKDIFLKIPSFVSKGETYITFIKGDAYYRNSLNSFSSWKRLIVGDRLGSSFMIKTKKASEVHINFSERSLLGIKGGSFLLVKEFTAKNLRLELKKGVLFGKFRKLYDGQPIYIQTPTSYATVIEDASMKIRLAKIKNQRKKKVKKTVFYVLNGVVAVSKIPFKENKQTYISSEEKYFISKKKSGPRALLSKKKQSKLTRLFDSLHKSEKYFITASVQFKVNSYEIDVDSFFELDKLLQIFQKRRSLAIKIKVHADSKNGGFYNNLLSLNRARSIRQYFIESDISKDRFEIQGYGANQSVASNTTKKGDSNKKDRFKKGRSKNRRVEFDISLE